MTFKQSEEMLTNRHEGPCKTKVFKVNSDIGCYIL